MKFQSSCVRQPLDHVLEALHFQPLCGRPEHAHHHHTATGHAGVDDEALTRGGAEADMVKQDAVHGEVVVERVDEVTHIRGGVDGDEHVWVEREHEGGA